MVLNENTMDIDETVPSTVNAKDDSTEYRPMEATGSIEALRVKLRTRMEELRRRKGPKHSADGAAGSKDELLEERRQQRAIMRERRRKETKEKKRREEEERARKGKGKEKHQAVSNAQNKVHLLLSLAVPSLLTYTLRSNSSFRI